MKLKILRNTEILKLQSLSLVTKVETNVNKLPSNTSKINIRKLNLNKIDSNDNNNYFNNLYLPIPIRKKRYIFGDFVSFVEKYNMLHRFILIKKGIQSTTQRFEVEIRRKYKTLKKNNIQNFNFDKYIKDIFYSVNFNFNFYERNYQKKLNIYKFCLTTKKFILLIIFKKIDSFLNLKKNHAIKLQSVIRSFIYQKKFNKWREELIIKITFMQKIIRGFLVRKKYKGNLVSIIDFIKYNQRMKEYNKNLKIMIIKRNAIRVIENWWEKILEERKRKELEEQIKKMPKDCQKLYRQFIRLGKQTKIIRQDMKEFMKKKIGFVP